MATANQETKTNGSGRDALAGIKVIDVDTHLTEPHDLWTSRAPAKWKDRVPQVKIVDGKRQWVIDGDRTMSAANPSSVVKPDGAKAKGIEFLKWEIEEVHPGSYDIEPRLKFMDGEGIWAQIIYPNLLGFGGLRAATLDPELRVLCTQIFNDAMAEIQAQSGNRIFPMALMPWWDIDITVKEAQRCHKMGLKGINTNSSPHDHKVPDLGEHHWDPLWEVCSDLNLPINFHIGSSTEGIDWFGKAPWPSQSVDRRIALGSTMLFMHNAQIFANIIYSGLLERFPKLKFVSVESGVGWMPFLLETLDYELEEAAPRTKKILTMKPSEYFKRNIYSCFWFEDKGLHNALDAVGVDNLMFETDFPHPTCLYPNALAHVAHTLEGLSFEDKRKLLSANAARVYSIPV
ncbi:MAG TPA: amidohydrolase family protein [Candidatus Binataceae bacterium]|jgi:predicted TIM-barrel fold metal-dependent hydrolase|nr:amidohydrolase family protein [Candidatus Binataceae bacterium]